jgi:hypothetical protein
VFDSKPQGIEWWKHTYKSNGYDLVVRRNDNRGGAPRFALWCVHSGAPTISRGKSQSKVSRKIGCPFYVNYNAGVGVGDKLKPGKFNLHHTCTPSADNRYLYCRYKSDLPEGAFEEAVNLYKLNANGETVRNWLMQKYELKWIQDNLLSTIRSSVAGLLPGKLYLHCTYTVSTLYHN